MINKILLLFFCCLLSACKMELYTKLTEQEANEMVALLLYKNIDASKELGNDGVNVLVDENDFINAVELLRQNGYPKQKRQKIEDMFPPGQLVSSPEQEKAKLSYLKGQQLEELLSKMDGVIDVSVAIATTSGQSGDTTDDEKNVDSVAVFIKSSPEINLNNKGEDIRHIILNAIPGVTPDKISLNIQTSRYLYKVSEK